MASLFGNRGDSHLLCIWRSSAVVDAYLSLRITGGKTHVPVVFVLMVMSLTLRAQSSMEPQFQSGIAAGGDKEHDRPIASDLQIY